jgi:hypothetical protein
MNKWKEVLCPRVTHCFFNKNKILFPSSFWGIFDFFVFFNTFGKIEKEQNKATLERRNEVHIHTSSKCKEHIDAQSKWTYAGNRHSGKIFHGSRCQYVEAKCYKACV